MVERAALYAGAEATIRRDHVVAVGFRVAPEDIFRFTSCLLSGDRSGSLTLMETLLRQGEEPLHLYTYQANVAASAVPPALPGR